MNPGAAGKYGFHKVKTLITFEIKHGKITNVNVIELGPRVQALFKLKLRGAFKYALKF